MSKRYPNKGGKKRGKKTAKKSTKKSRAKARGHRLVRYNRLAKKIGKRAAHAEVYGKGKRHGTGRKAGKKARAGGRRHHGGGAVSRCTVCRRTIFGGHKGMDTHFRKHHGRVHQGQAEKHRFAGMSWLEKIQARRSRKLAKKNRARSINAGMKGHQPQPSGFNPELRARLLRMKAEREAAQRHGERLPLPG